MAGVKGKAGRKPMSPSGRKRRVVLYLARFLTSRQRECNYATLNALRNLDRGLSRLEQEQARQFQQLRAELERLREEGRRAA